MLVDTRDVVVVSEAIARGVYKEAITDPDQLARNHFSSLQEHDEIASHVYAELVMVMGNSDSVFGYETMLRASSFLDTCIIRENADQGRPFPDIQFGNYRDSDNAEANAFTDFSLNNPNLYTYYGRLKNELSLFGGSAYLDYFDAAIQGTYLRHRILPIDAKSLIDEITDKPSDPSILPEVSRVTANRWMLETLFDEDQFIDDSLAHLEALSPFYADFIQKQAASKPEYKTDFLLGESFALRCLMEEYKKRGLAFPAITKDTVMSSGIEVAKSASDNAATDHQNQIVGLLGRTQKPLIRDIKAIANLRGHKSLWSSIATSLGSSLAFHTVYNQASSNALKVSFGLQ